MNTDSPADKFAKLDDPDLIAACLAGEEQAWVALIARYNRLIYTIPLRFGFPKSIADEIFQETCVILLEGLENLHDHQRLRSWLVTVARRACIKRWRRPEEPMAEMPEVAQTANNALEDNLGQLEQQFLIRQAFANLSPRCQAMLAALFVADPPHSYERVAADLDISLGSVGPLRARCLERLQREMNRLEHM